jgi:RNA polymerase sigma-70 factor (ECF subfamily)
MDSGGNPDRDHDQGDDDDEWLMAQVAAGRADSMEPLVRRHGTPLLTFVRRMAGDLHRAEELFQEVFLAVWAKRHTYRPPMRFKPWLYRIAVNKCRAAFRPKGLGLVRSLSLPLDAPPGAEGGDDAPGVDPGPLRAAIATETAGLVEAAVAALPEKQRVVVILRVWNDLSYAEVAQALGVREATARSNMHDALAAIRRQLAARL